VARGHRDLKVFQRAYSLAQEIFEASKTFPKEERYALTDQIRRSSRSVAANIAEAFRKARYPNLFLTRITDADAEGTETQVWLDFARDCGYLSKERSEELLRGYEEVGRMLGKILVDPSGFRQPE
jgi:four helix bundle protein